MGWGGEEGGASPPAVDPPMNDRDLYICRFYWSLLGRRKKPKFIQPMTIEQFFVIVIKNTTIR